MDKLAIVRAYHERTKHQLKKYARGPQTLDWDAQPNPFRHYNGCHTVSLPLSARDDKTTFESLYQTTSGRIRPISLQHIGMLMELSMALSAWKSLGPDRWSLRVNPSSGNLHPTECYLLLPETDEFKTGVYHYLSYEHALEQRCIFTSENKVLASDQFLLGLSSIYKRESWKYGERAYRYCQLDVGHALAAIRYACSILGWECQLLDECGDKQIGKLLGLDRQQDFVDAEPESPDLLLNIGMHPQQNTAINLDALTRLAEISSWQGRANRLTDDNFYKWPVINEVSQACYKPPTTTNEHTGTDPFPPLPQCDPHLLANDIIRQRRSAQSFDANAPGLSLPRFERILHSILPRPGILTWDCLPWDPRIHIILFIHRVTGLVPGLYVLPRSEQGEKLLRHQINHDFSWLQPENLGTGLPLYLLQEANVGNLARMLACHQPIASDSAFSLAMLSEFDGPLKNAPWQYRHLFWEAGLIGQILYLEAEVAGIRGTGIGCFFDDALHELLGLESSSFQDLYHFTIGTPKTDQRIQNEPPYAHIM